MPENLTSMKRTAKENKDGEDCCVEPGKQDDYSYGLMVDLRDEEIKKLGLTLPEVGSTMVLIANVKVISVRESADENGSDRNIELQITEMDLAPYEKTG